MPSLPLTAKEPTEPQRIEVLSMPQLMELDCEVEFDIDNILVARQPCVILGPPKTLKTTIALDLALSLATGGRFLGAFPCNRRRRVLVLSGESGASVIRETLVRQSLAKGVELSTINSLNVSENLPELTSKHELQKLKNTLRDYAIDTLVVDPLYLSLDTNGRESSIFGMGPLLREVNGICRESDTTLCLVHHSKEPRGDKPGNLSDALWAGPREFARQWISLSRREPYRAASGTHLLWLSGGGSAGHSFEFGIDIDEGAPPKRRWDVQIKSAEAAWAERRAIRSRSKGSTRELIAALRASLLRTPEQTRSALAKSVHRSTSGIAQALHDGIEQGLFEECRFKKNRREESGIRLRTEN